MYRFRHNFAKIMEGNIFVSIRNALNNCGIRHVEYGTKRVQQNTRKRGINMLINIMSRFGRNLETESKVFYIINYSTVAAYLPTLYSS